MIVNYLDDSNRNHLLRVDPAVRFNRNRVMIGSENQPVRMNEINGILYQGGPGCPKMPPAANPAIALPAGAASVRR